MPRLVQAGRAVWDARELRNISQKGLCRKVPGLSLYELQQIERGENEELAIRMYGEIAAALNIPVSHLDALANIPDEMPSPQIVIDLQRAIRRSMQIGDR